MEVLISVSGDDEVGEMADLWQWLRSQRELTGAIRDVRAAPDATDLGSALDALAVAIGSGGMGVALAQSLVAWIRTRRATVTVTVKTVTETKSITASNMDVQDVILFLDRSLNQNDE
jgi:hypothetical protein